MKLWNVTVYCRRYGIDTYMVVAETQLEAFKACRERLENETDYPHEWVILEAEEIEEND